ncbi:hypothetical protein J1N35_000096 [Gossypium stocksii]|uniref:Uncharacterized protein n=1 Tax=Gossypium stocksii TaxID=47602 RepID=A0A9D4AKG9_9ROSI|nr:hypothetical protein J1N35_000096 [Gossypium stocksii]
MTENMGGTEVNTLIQEVIYDIPNFDDEDHYTVVNHIKLNDKVHQEIVTRNHDEDLKMEEGASDPIDIVVNVGVVINTEFKLVLNEGVMEFVHFLVIVGESQLKDSMSSFHSHSKKEAKLEQPKPHKTLM